MIATPKKEWLGESGYCNCLLVAMSRVPIPTIELVEDEPAPNLEKLTSSKPDTRSWIRVQEFDFAALNTCMIIQILADSADITPLAWSGTIEAHDCVEDDGPVVERLFHLHLTCTNDRLRLTVSLDGA